MESFVKLSVTGRIFIGQSLKKTSCWTSALIYSFMLRVIASPFVKFSLKEISQPACFAGNRFTRLAKCLFGFKMFNGLHFNIDIVFEGVLVYVSRERNSLVAKQLHSKQIANCMILLHD